MIFKVIRVVCTAAVIYAFNSAGYRWEMWVTLAAATVAFATIELEGR